jgi:hypothetical protein
MRRTPMALLLLFLAAAAAPPGPCGPAAGARQPDGTDAVGGLAFPTFSAVERSCEDSGVLPSIPQTARTGNEARDILHSLPSPDALRPIDQPRRAPIYR